MTKPWRGRAAYLLFGLTIAAAIGYGFMPRPLAVELAPVSTGDLAVTVEEEGKTRVRERYVIAAPVAGHARRIELKVGHAVAAGQTVAFIEPARAASLDPRSRAQAEAGLAAARSALPPPKPAWRNRNWRAASRCGRRNSSPRPRSIRPAPASRPVRRQNKRPPMVSRSPGMKWRPPAPS
jgi:HlyD family secretion protein